MRAAVATDIPRLRLARLRVTRRARTDLRNRLVLPSRAVDECDVGPVGAVPGIGGRVDDAHRVADAVVVDQRAERATELPSRVVGAGERRSPAAAEAQRDELVF